jgi:carboxyl-terminal processing protease
VAKGILNRYSITYVDNNRKKLKATYPTEEKFIDNFTVTDAMIQEIKALGDNDSVKFNDEEFQRSNKLIRTIVKAIVGRDLFETATYYKVVNPTLNPVYREALLLINDNERYNRLLRDGRK